MRAPKPNTPSGMSRTAFVLTWNTKTVLKAVPDKKCYTKYKTEASPSGKHASTTTSIAAAAAATPNYPAKQSLKFKRFVPPTKKEVT